MGQSKKERLKISNELLDNFLVGVKSQDDLWGKDGVITQLNKAILERILNAEMDLHLQDTTSGRIAGNSRNGHVKKKVSGTFGEIELETPRDRQSTFEPHIIPKRSTKLAMIDNAILSLYAKEMTVRDIQATLLELYHVEVLHSLISKVTEAVNEEVEQWRDRPLEAVYPLVWFDGIVVKVHQNPQNHILGIGDKHGWVQGTSGNMDSGNRRCKILGAGSHGIEQQRCQRCLCLVH